MATLSFIYESGLWISVPVFLLSVGLLIFFIVRVIRLVGKAPIISAPLIEKQEIEFAGSGRVDLCIEGPMLTPLFSRLKYELITASGTQAKSHIVLFRTRTAGFQWVRLKMRTFDIPSPGRYVFQIHGLAKDWTPDTKHRIVFTRPHTALAMCYIIGIVFSAILNIGSIVLSLMHLLGV